MPYILSPGGVWADRDEIFNVADVLEQRVHLVPRARFAEPLAHYTGIAESSACRQPPLSGDIPRSMFSWASMLMCSSISSRYSRQQLNLIGRPTLGDSLLEFL